jgi:hypothetical protein
VFITKLLKTVMRFRFTLEAKHFLLIQLGHGKKSRVWWGKKTLDPSSSPSVVPASSLGPTSTKLLVPVVDERCHMPLGNKRSWNKSTGEMEKGSGKVWRVSIHGLAVVVSVYKTGCCSLSIRTKK